MLVRRKPRSIADDGSAATPVRLRIASSLAAFRPLRLASVLLPLLVFAGGASWSWQQLEAEARARLTRTVEILREHALRAFETQETVLVAVTRATEGMEWEEMASSRALHELLRALDSQAAALDGIGLVRPDGRMVATGGSFPFEPLDVSDREYFRANRAMEVGSASRSFVGEVAVTQPRDVPAFSLSHPRRDPAGGFDGLVVATSTPEYFADFYAQLAESPNDVAVLFRFDGALLARWPPVSDWRNEQARMGGLTEEMASAPPGRGVTTFHSVLDGKEHLFALRQLERYPVAVAYGLNLAALRSAWLRQLAVIGSICTLTGGLMLGLTARAAAAARRERAAAERVRAEAERRAEAEAALREGQRLEALGQLAAGVAHDFRNTVQAVQAGVQLIRQALDASDTIRAREIVSMVADAAGRGAALTERMLAVARREGSTTPGAGHSLLEDPARAVTEICELLRCTLGAGIRVRCEASKGVPSRVRGDRAELEAALINLIVNARDAMPQGGDVVVSVAPEKAVAAKQHPAGLAPGCYARIVVADTGIGMDAATLARATEPFFTTKPRGKGTGLGLATVRAFAEGAGGVLRIESAPGRGTTVTVWLPAAGAAPAREQPGSP